MQAETTPMVGSTTVQMDALMKFPGSRVRGGIGAFVGDGNAYM